MPTPLRPSIYETHKSFYITLDGEDISASSRLGHTAEHIKKHAFHAASPWSDHTCQSVAQTVDHMVIGLLENHVLAHKDSESKRLADILTGDRAPERAAAFRKAARAQPTIIWQIDQETEILSFKVPLASITPQQQALFKDAPTETNSLTLQTLEGTPCLILNISYNQSQFLRPSETAPPQIGNLAQQTLHQIRHAISYETTAPLRPLTPTHSIQCITDDDRDEELQRQQARQAARAALARP